MILTTATYLLVISIITALAAWIAERGLQRAGIPTRWAWLSAMLVGPVLLAADALVPGSAPAMLTGGAVGPVIALPALEVGPGAGRLGIGTQELLLGTWILASLTMAALVVVTGLRLRHERRGWTRREMEGRAVWISDGRGPAVTGVLRPWIVLPRWFEELPEPQRALVLLHEEEHLRGRDTLLLALALGLLCFTPWNPVTWVHFRRLRAAVEVDCDRRVLRQWPDPASYGSSLIAIAARSSAPSLGLAAFTERSSALEGRIIAMTHRRTPWSSLHAALFTLLAIAVGVQACGVEGPVSLDEGGIQTARIVEVPPPEPDLGDSSASESSTEIDPNVETIREAEQRSAAELAVAPTFTPFTTAPSITNREEVIGAMSRSYPPLLKDAGIGGTVRVYFFINDRGMVEQVRLDQSSGHEALDQAALDVAGAYEFNPALRDGDPVPVWVSFPITFQVR